MRRAFPLGMSAVVVLFLFALPGPTGCRENPPVAPPSAPPSFAFRWNVGDRMTFDTWALDSNGYSITSSKCVSSRRVIATGVQFQGRDNVDIMLDSIAIPGKPFRGDTVYFSQTSTGDLWQYGLLSSLGRRYGEGVAAPQWELIAPLSGSTTSWTVGYADATGPVLGSITAESSYFSVVIGGVNFVYQTDRVDLSGLTVGESFWIATVPPVFAAFVESSTPASEGLYRLLTSAQLAAY